MSRRWGMWLPWGWCRACRRVRRRDDGGAATVEFVFVGLMTLIPLFYIAIAAFSVQGNVLATTQAAREAGRMFATAPDVPTGVYRAQYAVRLALGNHGIDDGGVVLRFVPLDSPCLAGGPAAPDPGVASLDPGAVFAICVVSSFDVPAVPAFMEGSSNTYTARYVVKADKFRKLEPVEGGSS
ncbi:MAG: hypothetical protein ACRDPW_04395 [Mycobacteriales bacterium]